jgi:hypothetical protein
MQIRFSFVFGKVELNPNTLQAKLPDVTAFLLHDLFFGHSPFIRFSPNQ